MEFDLHDEAIKRFRFTAQSHTKRTFNGHEIDYLTHYNLSELKNALIHICKYLKYICTGQRGGCDVELECAYGCLMGVYRELSILDNKSYEILKKTKIMHLPTLLEFSMSYMLEDYHMVLEKATKPMREKYPNIKFEDLRMHFYEHWPDLLDATFKKFRMNETFVYIYLYGDQEIDVENYRTLYKLYEALMRIEDCKKDDKTTFVTRARLVHEKPADRLYFPYSLMAKASPSSKWLQERFNNLEKVFFSQSPEVSIDYMLQDYESVLDDVLPDIQLKYPNIDFSELYLIGVKSITKNAAKGKYAPSLPSSSST